MTSNIIVYSAVTASYDMVFKPRVCTDNVEYILFLDRPRKVKGWNVLPISNVIKGDKSLTNRWYKFFPHEAFKEAEYSVYVDGNIRVIGDLELLIQEFKESGAALGVFKHTERTNISQEVDACLQRGKFSERDKQQVKKQIKSYSEAGMPQEQPLADNGVIFRWHKHPMLSEAMTSWWEQLLTFSKRDQISLPYIVWKNNLPVKYWSGSLREENKYFELYSHRKSIVINLITKIRIYRNDYILARFAHNLIKNFKNIYK
jgi:hypothetical protein